ncbi:MAG: glycosyltransferase family 2 protein [Paludibacteraceae bacterium]|nr:glycosyltransferase family 2 protein [Paludibacteraceae bacterium]
MKEVHIITPVKDSPNTTLKTLSAIMSSEMSTGFSYTIYNDFSNDDTTQLLSNKATELHFEHINLAEITTHPSPNYLLVLQTAQQKAIAGNAHLIIVESDVVVAKNTLQALSNYASLLDKPGMLAAVTVDESGKINFPYLYAQKLEKGVHNTRKRLSFCCTMITNELLHEFDFKNLNPEKSWYDVFISHKSVELGFSNYLLTNLPVLHMPHSSRPWKHLKYSNPLKYYWRKLINNKDKI